MSLIGIQQTTLCFNHNKNKPPCQQRQRKCHKDCLLINHMSKNERQVYKNDHKTIKKCRDVKISIASHDITKNRLSL